MPNAACMMVNTRTATCQDLSETTAYPSFTETTTACRNAAQSVALGAACCALTDCAEGFCDLFGGDAGAPTNVCATI